MRVDIAWKFSGWCLAALVALAGCGGSVAEGTTGSGGSAHGGAGGSGGSGLGGSGGTGGSDAVCTGFEDENGSAAVTFHIRNQTGQSIYLMANCGTTPRYDIFPAGGGEDAAVWGTHGGGCLQTCADLQNEGPIACDPCAPTALRLDPGATLDTTWDGTGLRPGYMMPAACYETPGLFDSCSRVVAASPGMWLATATAYSECAASACSCGADGVCGGTPSGVQASANPATFSYPDQTSVDVIFDSCAFGCPGP
jgi:hypothetical protein